MRPRHIIPEPLFGHLPNGVLYGQAVARGTAPTERRVVDYEQVQRYHEKSNRTLLDATDYRNRFCGECLNFWKW